MTSTEIPTCSGRFSTDEESKLLNGDKDQNTVGFPKSVFFIIGNEFCERFSYMGLRAVLTLYLSNVLKFDDNVVIGLFHGFISVCYFTPVFGAIIADGLIGKFRTILYISIVHAGGNIMLAAAATKPFNLPMVEFSIIGLVLIGIGTGGIKPCVAPFGGDQFKAVQGVQLEKFFSVFYCAVNTGSLLSGLVTPRLRDYAIPKFASCIHILKANPNMFGPPTASPDPVESHGITDIRCFGEDSCFPLVFGVPAVLMLLALVLFIAGKPFYNIKPAKGAVLTDFCKCVFVAISRSIRSNTKKEHWLDHAEDKFSKKFIKNTKSVIAVLKLYIPIPFFWALFDQMGSRWVLQATHLDGRIPGTNFYLLPDQIGLVNPVLILTFIPLFEFAVYPALAKLGLLKKPLQKMCVGGFLAALAYVVAGILQLKIEATMPTLPNEHNTQIRFINAAPCEISITSKFLQINLVNGNFHLTGTDIEAGEYNISVTSVNCSALNKQVTFTEYFNYSSVYSVIIGQDMSMPGEDFVLFKDIDSVDKLKTNGRTLISVSYVMPKPDSFAFDKHKFQLNATKDYGSTAFEILDPGSYKISVTVNDTSIENIASIDVDTGSIIRYVVISDGDLKNLEVNSYMLVEPNRIHMAWQLPQYIIISTGEILLSITGLHFSYSQAPNSMKSVLFAAWLLTVSFGNCIVLIMELIGTLPLPSQEYFLFSGLMTCDMCIFIVLAHFYKYVNFDDDEVENESTKTSEVTSL